MRQRHQIQPTAEPVSPGNIRRTVLALQGEIATSVETAGFMPISIIDLPLADTAEPLLRLRFSSPVAFTGGSADAAIAAAGSPVFSIRKNGVQAGTVTFTNSTGAVSFSAPNYGAGDIFELYPPNPQDSTLDRVSITLETS